MSPASQQASPRSTPKPTSRTTSTLAKNNSNYTSSISLDDSDEIDSDDSDEVLAIKSKFEYGAATAHYIHE